MIIVRGTNTPIILVFPSGENVEGLDNLLITLSEYNMYNEKKNVVKTWGKSDIEAEGNIAICPITKEETYNLKCLQYIISAKWTTADGYEETSYPEIIQAVSINEINCVSSEG